MNFYYVQLLIYYLPFQTNCFYNFKGSFGRRASDGGANLHIYYPTTNSNGQQVENMYSHPNSRECLRMGVDGTPIRQDHMSLTIDGNDESSDEIQR